MSQAIAAAHLAPPKSAVVTWHGWTGVIGFGAALAILRAVRMDDEDALLLIMILTAAPILILEGRTALQSKRLLRAFDKEHLQRLFYKSVGLLQTWILIAFAYWLIPYYVHGPAQIVLNVLREPYVWPVLLGITAVYLSLEDRTSPDPEDTLYLIGRKVLGIGVHFGRGELREYALGWAVKAFFLPLMVSACIDNIHWWANQSFANEGYFPIYELLYGLVYFIDVAFASCGYVFALKLFGTQIQSSQPRVLGWLVALVCYPPFWPGLSDAIFLYNPDGRVWGDFFGGVPGLSQVWAFVLLSMVVIYVSATIQFGVRFSNLTNRGILTNGPYRWLKHPAYLSKNISWWMLSVPFLVHVDYAQSIRSCVLLLALNGIYYLRGKTEEQHLSADPVYRDYLAYMNESGLGAILRRRILGLKSYCLTRRPGDVL